MIFVFRIRHKTFFKFLKLSNFPKFEEEFVLYHEVGEGKLMFETNRNLTNKIFGCRKHFCDQKKYIYIHILWRTGSQRS